MRLIRKIIDAGALIMEETIEEWVTKTTRQDLLTTIQDLSTKIHHLEDDLDRASQENAELLSQLFDVQTQLADLEAERGKDPNPFDPYAPNVCGRCHLAFTHCNCPASCVGVTPPNTATSPPMDWDGDAGFMPKPTWYCGYCRAPVSSADMSCDSDECRRRKGEVGWWKSCPACGGDPSLCACPF